MQFDEISRNAAVKKIRRNNNNFGGIFLCIVAVGFVLCTAFEPMRFLSDAVYGIFGLYCYVYSSMLFAIGLAMILRKKLKTSRKFVILCGLLIFSLFSTIHLAFTNAQLSSGTSFGEYITGGFGNNGKTPGGILFAIPTYVLFAVCQLEGSIVLLAVLFVVSLSLITSYLVTSVGEKSAVTLAETQLGIETTGNKKVSDDYKKSSKELQDALDAKYQELLQKQSAKRMAAGKSELGLTNAPPKTVSGAIYDKPIPLNKLQPTEPSAPEQITQWSTEAAQKFNAGLGYSYGPQSQFGQNAVNFNQGQLYNNPQPLGAQHFGQQPQFNTQQSATPNFNPQQYTTPTAQNSPDGLNKDRLNRRLEQARKRLGMSGSLDDRINSRGTGGSNRTQQPSGEQMRIDVKPQKQYKPRQYIKPPISLIRTESSNLSLFHQDALEKQKLLDIKLEEFGVNAKVTGFSVAPAVTRFEVQLATGARVAHVEQLSKDISYALGSKQIRLELVEGKNAIGIEVPNKSVGLVSIKDILASREFIGSKSPLTVAIGKNLSDETVIGDITTMPHLLIAGSTGTGKSVCLNTLLVSLLYRAHPDEVKLLLVDPKRVELNQYNDGPHMLIPSAITDIKQSINALKWLEHEMRRRYDVLKSNGVNNLGLYHSLPSYQNGTLERLPYIVMVIDEAADLLNQGKKEVEASIQSLSSLARACGIHIVLATQRPSTDVITGVIKTNFVVRMAFQVANRHDSATIINDTGAEKLVGKGDMLFIEKSNCQRVQCAFVELAETVAVMNFIRKNNTAEFDPELENVILNGLPDSNNVGGGGNAANGFGDADFARGKAGQDPLFTQILQWLVRDENVTRTASISSIQRNFNVGFARAGRIIDQLAEAGYISSGGGTKPRNVLVSSSEVGSAYGNNASDDDYDEYEDDDDDDSDYDD